MFLLHIQFLSLVEMHQTIMYITILGVFQWLKWTNENRQTIITFIERIVIFTLLLNFDFCITNLLAFVFEK